MIASISLHVRLEIKNLINLTQLKDKLEIYPHQFEKVIEVIFLTYKFLPF